MKIETRRLILRPLRLSDAEDIVKNINNLNVSKWLLVIRYPYLLKDAKNWIKSTQKKWKKKKIESYEFGIELKSERKIIGAIGLNIKRNYKATVGYWIGEKYWRKRYGSEALGKIIQFAFKKLKLKRLEAEVFVGNPSSGKLLEKFGFKKEGYAKKLEICKADGKVKDGIRYGILEENFKERL
jgi:RimJ/RimL family protein N-acetyltransferase